MCGAELPVIGLAEDRLAGEDLLDRWGEVLKGAQFQPKQAAEHVVVSEPGTARVEGQNERVGVL